MNATFQKQKTQHFENTQKHFRNMICYSDMCDVVFAISLLFFVKCWTFEQFPHKAPRREPVLPVHLTQSEFCTLNISKLCCRTNNIQLEQRLVPSGNPPPCDQKDKQATHKKKHQMDKRNKRLGRKPAVKLDKHNMQLERLATIHWSVNSRKQNVPVNKTALNVVYVPCMKAGFPKQRDVFAQQTVRLSQKRNLVCSWDLLWHQKIRKWIVNKNKEGKGYVQRQFFFLVRA